MTTTPDFAISDTVGAGKHLIISAALVGDHDDYFVWRARRDDWIRNLHRGLTDHYGSGAARAVAVATEASADRGEPWPDTLTRSVEGIAETLAILADVCVASSV